MRKLHSGTGRGMGGLIWLRWLALACLLAGAASSAFAAKTYTDNGDGTVTDPTTGLQWMRCSMGQTWDGVTCTGTANKYDWESAVALTGTQTFVGHSDWRLPNIRELLTIVDRSHYPAIDEAAFPNWDGTDFWSASAYVSSSTYAWLLSTYSGAAHPGSKFGVGYYGAELVFLVRGGQPVGLLDTSRPSTDYIDHDNGTVTHTPTGLMWQRCSIGQTWDGVTCTGTANNYTWDAAKLATSSFSGQNDWRLPTEDELGSLVDFNKSIPAINVTLFPNTPASAHDSRVSYFWSASASAYNSSTAWVVGFNYGDAISNFKNSPVQVRLVRAGQCFGPLTLSVSKSGTGQVNNRMQPGISCDQLSGNGYNPGDVVTLTATPAANLISWGGACSGNAPTCTVTMDAAKSVTASFIDTSVISGLPTSLTFPLQNIASTSAAQQVTLTNTGTAALTGLGISASAEYAVNHNCGSGLIAGGNCTLDITFTPATVGTRSGTITISSNAPGTPHSIALAGIGQGSTIEVSSFALTFASQAPGTTSAGQTVTLRNSGGAVLNITNKVVNGDFAISVSTCSATLAQASSCSISVTFKPTVSGVRSGSLVISSDALVSPTTTVNLDGTGAGVALVSLNPTSLTFVAQTVGSTSAEQTLVLTNTGGAALTLAAGSIVASAEFALTSNTCSGGLGAGGFCYLGVTFKPSATGSRTGILTITSNAVGSPHSAGLSGAGVMPTVCTLVANPNRIQPRRSSTLTASCNPAATSYTWIGGTCAGGTAATCVVTPTLTTAYGVTGTNDFGISTATADVTVRAVDLTPILMLLLDD